MDDEANDASSYVEEVEWLRATINATKRFVSAILDVPQCAFDEAIKTVELIGRDADVTMLYDTITCGKLWRLAVTPYRDRTVERTMFGLMTYALDCPLDRIVYTMLSSQSLTVAYDAYKRAMTADRMRSLAPVIDVIEHVRRCSARSDASLYDELTRVCRPLRSSVTLHGLAFSALNYLDATTVTGAAEFYADLILRASRAYARAIERMRESFDHHRDDAATLPTTATDRGDSTDDGTIAAAAAPPTIARKRRRPPSDRQPSSSKTTRRV